MSEQFDIYDESLRHIGVKSREAVHRDGDWHQVFHCWMVGRELNGDEFVILQMRHDDKDMYPGKVDISAAGHLEAGESVADGVREIEEELGLRVNFEDLVPLGRRLGISRYRDVVDCQICHVFFCVCSRSLADYNYREDEVKGLLKLPLDAGLSLLSGEVDSVMVEAVGLRADRVTIGVGDFIPSVDHYALKTLILAKRYFAGEKHLYI
ncbi:MAG: NUDIX domain-containing protein [Chloroflexi bacterium]|nr:NUDIX domain-containing protein [Chloroflexota bacterium]